MYTVNHPGVLLSNTALNALSSKSIRLIGFLKASDFSALFFRQTNAVGVRVYEANNEKMVAVSVSADGFELPSQLKSQASTADNRVGAEMPAAGTDFSSDVPDEPTSAFFSKEMIIDSLTSMLNNSPLEGIAFYKLEDLDDQHFTEDTVKDWNKTQVLSSFVAVPLNLSANGEIPSLANNTSNAVLSDLPCPGYCLSISNQDVVSVEMYPAGKATLNGRKPYLKPWN